ncbi:hypothetical protein ACQBAU_18590 [Propionibacteriaceae bacterium Y2011]
MSSADLPRLPRRRLLASAAALPLLGAATRPAVAAPTPTVMPRSTTRAAFDALDQRFHGGNGVADATNEQGLYSWQQSKVLQAYLFMYRAHRDLYYLDKFVRQADTVLANRDSERGVTDHRGKSLPAWRNRIVTIDPANLSMHIGVDIGNITQPMTGFARLVDNTAALRRMPKYRAAAERYHEAAGAAVAVVADDFDRSDAVYRFAKGGPYQVDGIQYPANMNHAIGHTLIDLQVLAWRRRVGTPHSNTLERLFNRWEQDWTQLSDTSLVWTHHHVGSWPYRGWGPEDGVSENRPSFAPGTRVADTGHGSMDVGFAEAAFHSGLISATRLRQMARTLTRHVITTVDGRPTAHRLIDGRKADTGQAKQEVHTGGWLPLAPWAQDSMVTKVAPLLDQNLDATGGTLPVLMASVAMLNFTIRSGGRAVSAYDDSPPRRDPGPGQPHVQGRPAVLN